MILSDADLESLLVDVESDRVERKESIPDGDRIREAICAFANDMPNNRQAGVVFVGVKNNGDCANLPITDQLLQTLAAMRSDGNILPIPALTVQKKTLRGCTMAVVIAEPSDAPPVRCKGRVWIRIGPTRAIASADEERRLNEKRRARDLPFDLHVVDSASLADLDCDRFMREYLSVAVAEEVLRDNERSVEDRLASLRFVDISTPYRPTIVGLLVVGKTPADFIPGAYIQFLRMSGAELSDPIADQHEVHGPVSDLLRRIDDIVRANIHVPTEFVTAPIEVRQPDYPLTAVQQIIRNAVMHRDYQTSNAPVRVHWFSDRIEI